MEIIPIREQVTAWRLEVECSETWYDSPLPGRMYAPRELERPLSTERHPSECFCEGDGKVQHPLVAAIELAETVACEGTLASSCRVIQQVPEGFRQQNPQWAESCDCKGTRRVLRAVDLDDPVSVAEACGRLLLVLDTHASVRGPQGYLGAPHYDLAVRIGHLNLPAAYQAIVKLQAALEVRV